MRRFSLATSLLLAAVLALGFAPLWGFVASTLVEWALPSKPRSSSFMIRPDGTPLLMQMDPANHSYVLTDMNGQPVDDNVSDASLPWVNLASLGSEHRSEHTWRQRIREFSDLRSRPTHWYAISNGQPQGRIYFVGYDVASKYRVGFIAKDGFRESPPPPEDCFLLCGNGGAIDDCVASLQPNRTYNRWGNTAYSISAGGESKDFNPWQLYVLGGEQKLYQIDLRTRTVNVVFTAPHLESCGLYAKDSKSPTWLIVRTDREVLMLNGQHKVERTYTIPAELASRSFRWAEVAPNQALATWTKYSLTVTEYGAEAVVWFDQTGQITRRETGPAQTIARLNTTISLACPIFVVITLVVTCIYPFELVGKGLTNSWSIAQGVVLQETWPSFAFVTIVSGLLAVACYRRQLRYSATPLERTVWPLFVFLGGLPVWVAYRFGHRWPVLDRCPECGAEVPRNRETCSTCRQDFPLPERQGFEILAV